MDNYPDGWPRVAAFLNSSDELLIFRRFGHIHSRLLLDLTVQITALETRLSRLDEEDAKASPETHNPLRTTYDEEGRNAEKEQLIEEIKAKMLEYWKYS